jgi:hypothetical protein
MYWRSSRLRDEVRVISAAETTIIDLHAPKALKPPIYRCIAFAMRRRLSGRFLPRI